MSHALTWRDAVAKEHVIFLADGIVYRPVSNLKHLGDISSEVLIRNP